MNKQTLRLLRLAPTKWDKAVARLNKGGKTDWQQIESELDAISQRAAMLSEYVSRRVGTDGCGRKDHGTAVRFANNQLVMVRRALGFSYPRAGVFTF